jgi:hypothetical protein
VTAAEVRPVSEPGPATTVVRTATAPAAQVPEEPGEDQDEGGKPAKAGKAPSFDRAGRVTDDALMEITRGRPEKAVRLMERAVPAPAGSGDASEGYAYHNLGRGLLDLGECEGAIPYLEAALGEPGSEAQLYERAECSAAPAPVRREGAPSGD